MKIGFAITSSYCTIEKIMEQILNLKVVFMVMEFSLNFLLNILQIIYHL